MALLPELNFYCIGRDVTGSLETHGVNFLRWPALGSFHDPVCTMSTERVASILALLLLPSQLNGIL